MSNNQIQEIKDAFENKGYKLLSENPNKKEKVKYECKCGNIFERLFRDIMRRNCRVCNSNKLREMPEEKYKPEDTENEIWKPITGGFVSSLGNCVNAFGQPLTKDSKHRYHINSKHQYISRLIAEAFQLTNYEKLSDKKYIVFHIDNNINNNILDNLIITPKSETGKINGKKSRKSELFQKKLELKQEDFEDIRNVVILELPNHTLYENGEVWNGKRFLTFSQSEGYLSLSLEKDSFKVHRLICYAFNPLPEKKCLDDYKGLQVNHKNGDKTDNKAENLEWVTQSENINHAYTTGLNKKRKAVIQKDKNTGQILGTYNSIAEASRKTGEPEHRISALANGRKCNVYEFMWEFKK
jgi:hypothetical protein